MSAHAAPAPTGPTFTIRGRPYPVLLPKLADPRLHLAAVIISLQVIGQIGFHFELSIAQILLAIGTCAVLEVAIAMRSQHVILWPASATLTGNGVAFVLRVPGTVHGDWWSLRGWWIYVGTAAVSLLSKHVIRWRGEHIFNPSNIGLVLCFLLLPRTKAAPLDFWWGPMSVWLALALAIIVAGGFAILRRLKLLRVALGFWVTFAAAIGVLALAGHTMTARWHLGPISGFQLWWVLVTSPEVLVFLFFMITDPKTAPRSPSGRLAYAISLGLLAGVLIAPTTTEYAAKVALLGSLALVCLALPLLRLVPTPLDRRRVAGVAAAAVAVSAAAMLVGNAPSVAGASRAVPRGALPPIRILPGHGVQTKLDLHTAQLIAHDLLDVKPSTGAGPLRVWLVQGVEQGPPTATVQQAGLSYHLHQTADGHWALPSTTQIREVEPAPVSTVLRGVRLTNVAPAVGLNFRQGSFRYGASKENTAMMGGGVCWLDYNGDGWQDLFAVNSYSSADTAQWEAHGGLPRTQLFENLHGHFRNVTATARAGLRVQGDGCAAADLNGDGRPDLIVTTTTGIKLLWNNGNGTFTEGARAAGMTASGWYTGVAVADVNGDGRPDVFVAGYARPYDTVPNSLAGFPTNVAGVRDLLFLNEGNGPNGRTHFREAGVEAGLEASGFSHGLGATFLDVNGDGRPDLYVANDEDPNQLYIDVPWPGGAKADPAGLGFRFENRAAASGVADPYAGMGVAVDGAEGGPLDLFVTNSRNEPSAAFARTTASSFSSARPDFDPALGTDFAGWGDSFADLTNSGRPDLVVATGGIPVTSLKKDAGPVKVIAPLAGEQVTRYGVAPGVAPRLRVNGRGLAAADVDNDGRVEIAVNSIGGKLLLLKPTGPVGHWLDVRLSRFSPGAVVTVDLGKTRLSQEVRSGSSYLSSEDERIHFGLGEATRAARVIVRYPWGARRPLRNVRADRVGRGRRASSPRSPGVPADGVVPPAGLPAGDRRRLDRDDLGRDRGRRAPLRRGQRAGAGTRPLRRLPRDVEGLGRCSEERVRPQRRDQLRRLPRAPLASVLRLEPEPNVRPADAKAACALLLARVHHHAWRVAGGAGQPDRRRRDRRRPARRLERIAALRRPDLHVSQPAPDLPLERLHRGGFDLLDSAGARNDPAAQPYAGAHQDPELRRCGVGARPELRAPAFASRPADRPGCATARRPFRPRLQAGGARRPAGDLGGRNVAARTLAADLEHPRRARSDGEPRQGRPSLSRRRRGAQRRCRRRLGRETGLPGATADLHDPLCGVSGPVERQEERQQGSALQPGRAAARPRPRRVSQRQGRGALTGSLGRRRGLVAARRHAAVARGRRRGNRVRLCGRQGLVRAHRSLVCEPDAGGEHGSARRRDRRPVGRDGRSQARRARRDARPAQAPSLPLAAGARLQPDRDRVERHRSEQHGAGDDVDPAVRDAQRVEAVLQRPDQDGAEQGTAHLAATAEEADPADHRGGDRVQEQIARRERQRDRVDLGGEDDPADRRHRARQREHEDAERAAR